MMKNLKIILLLISFLTYRSAEATDLNLKGLAMIAGSGLAFVCSKSCFKQIENYYEVCKRGQECHYQNNDKIMKKENYNFYNRVGYLTGFVGLGALGYGIWSLTK